MTGSLDVNNPVAIGSYHCGEGQPLTVIAGPCVLEDLQTALEIARQLASEMARRKQKKKNAELSIYTWLYKSC